MKSLETAMPMLIPPLSITEEQVQKLERHILPKNLVSIDEAAHVSQYEFGTKSSGGMILVNTLVNKIFYFVKYELIQFTEDIRPIRQVLVWRAPPDYDSYLIYKTPAEIVLEYAIPKYHMIVTDTMQSPSGRSLWEYLLQKAWRTNLHVYAIYRPGYEHPTYTKIADLSPANLPKERPQLFGTSERNKYALILISDTPLTTGFYHKGKHIGE